jgi:hypothetical protein
VVNWKAVPNSSFQHFVFQVPVVTADEEILRWVGYFQDKHGVRRHGFSLTYRNKYVVRSWDMSTKHFSKKERRYVKGAGRHKHYYL